MDIVFLEQYRLSGNVKDDENPSVALTGIVERYAVSESSTDNSPARWGGSSRYSFKYLVLFFLSIPVNANTGCCLEA